MSFEILDPTYGDDTADFAYASRLPSLKGAVVGIVSNGKQGTVRFFDALEDQLLQLGVKRVERTVKTNYSAPANVEIIDAAKEWNALVSGIGD